MAPRALLKLAPTAFLLSASLQAPAAPAALPPAPDGAWETRLASPDAAEAPRLISRTDGLEVRAVELKDGSQLVALINRSGRKPAVDESKAAYAGPPVTKATPGHAVDIEVPLNGANKLYLVVSDGGDGNSGDHADWVEPRLTGPAGELRLTELKWVSATSGWGAVTLGKSAGGAPLQVGGHKAAYGIGTHADSVIEYDLPSGYTHFKARTGADRTGAGRGSMKFSVFTQSPWKKPSGAETVAVALRDLGYAVPCTVTDTAAGRDPVRETDKVAASVPLRSASVLRVAPERPAARTEIRSGEVWGDTQGRVIQAHGGGVMFHEGVYYWYGENKNGPTKPSPVDRVDVIGVSCYSSRDLLNWKYEGLALRGVDAPGHDLRPEMVLERPKVVYNARTKKFVMWAHIDSADYAYARGGVAVSDSPAGPFAYLGSVRPEGQMCRDMTLFVDDDGSAYHIYASENNATLYISRLSDDYTRHTGVYAKAFEKKYWEAPAVFKRGGRYYMIASGQSGWAPNPARAACAPSILGPWTELGNPCRGEKARTTYDGQSTHVLPVAGKPDTFVFMADRWNPANLRDSRYLWLPIRFEDDKPVIEWKDAWSPEKL